MNRKLILKLTLGLLAVAPMAYYSGVTAHWSQAFGASPPNQSDLQRKTESSESFQGLTSASLLRRSAHRLKTWQPLQASVRHQIEILGERLTGPGRYLQEGQGSNKARLEITFKSGNFKSDLTQINDGRFLYIRNDADSVAPMQRIDLAKLGQQTRNRDAQQNSLGTSRWMAMGGLAYLIEQLEEDFEFGKPLTSELGGLDVFVLEGTWKPPRIASICKNLIVVDEDGKLLYEKLPLQMPSHVRIALGRNDPLGLFPHQIVYLRKQDSANSFPRLKPIATFEFHDVKPASDLNATTFQIEEDNTRLTDITQSVFQLPKKKLR